MKNIKKYIPILLLLLVTSSVSYTQETMPKHEVGFSMGVFPLVGFLSPPNDGGPINFGDYGLAHTSHYKREDGRYEKTYHFGSYALNYNYHFNRKHSIGTSLSWVGRHVDKYDWIMDDTINGRGWKHYFSLHFNYRYTYYRKNNTSLYFGYHHGIVLCVRDKNILYKNTHHFLFGTISNDQYYLNPAMHITAFGIDVGTKHIFNMELGIGTQGILKTGYKYKF
ncbi:MAG: hypothetical protein FWG79_05620 [Bacteroidales bacterium]|nr:hypothetical protein [Bacteroidales bacterium]